VADSLINAVSSPTGLDAAATVKSKDSPEKISAAASQFEALLISQVLKSAHEGEDGGWLGAGEDESSSTTTGMADEYFARAIAAHGGLGLAKTISEGLSRNVTAAANSIAAKPSTESDSIDSLSSTLTSGGTAGPVKAGGTPLQRRRSGR